MKYCPFILLFLFFILVGCGGGGGGGSSTNNNTSNNNSPATTTAAKSSTNTSNANNTAPWKNEQTITPKGGNVATAKNNLSSLNSSILVGIASSGKKNKTDTIKETIKGPIRGSIVYKNSYTIDDVIVNDAYSYTSNTEVKYLGYEEICFGLNGESKFNITYQQASLNNFTYTSKGESSISYKDPNGVFVFHMTYEDISTMVNGVETVTSTYTIDDEVYTSVGVYQQNGDYVYTSTYQENGITFTSVETATGNTTTYVIFHVENGINVIDEESSSTLTVTFIDGIETEIFTYSYVENGIVYTNTSTTANGVTTEVLSHIENGVVVIDEESTGTYTLTFIDGLEAEVYTEEYIENGILYTLVSTTIGETTTYVVSHIENGVVITDSTSSYTISIVNGVETEYYTEVYVVDGITYYYSSTTADGVTNDLITYFENGQSIIASEGYYTEELVNGQIVGTYVQTYFVDGITYESVSTTVNNVTTVVTTWVEDGIEHTYTETF